MLTGEGRIHECLRSQRMQLSPECRKEELLLEEMEAVGATVLSALFCVLFSGFDAQPVHAAEPRLIGISIFLLCRRMWSCAQALLEQMHKMFRFGPFMSANHNFLLCSAGERGAAPRYPASLQG